MAYIQKTDNGACTCDLSVETYGWTKNALAAWSTPTPIASHFGSGYVVKDFDRGAKLTGTSELYRVDSTGGSVRLMRQSFLNSSQAVHSGGPVRRRVPFRVQAVARYVRVHRLAQAGRERGAQDERGACGRRHLRVQAEGGHRIVGKSGPENPVLAVARDEVAGHVPA